MGNYRWSKSREVIGSVLKSYRLALNYSQKEAAERIGIAQSEVSRFENADRGLELGDLVQILNAYEKTLPQFVAVYEDQLKRSGR